MLYMVQILKQSFTNIQLIVHGSSLLHMGIGISPSSQMQVMSDSHSEVQHITTTVL